jgi:asparagine N-glycosylation enzyme membrane subunit Stt3
MAAFHTAHVSEFLVVPLLGALCVWLTYIVGRRVDRPLTGGVAALLLLCSPTFLYQLVQPMSDVPAAAWWMLTIAWALEREDGSNSPVLAGLAASMALLTRPNLLPLAGVVAVYLFVSRRRGGGLSCAMRFALGLVPGAVLLAVLQRDADRPSPLAMATPAR